MKKLLPYLLFGVMLLSGLGLFILNNYDPYADLPQVTLDRINIQEAEWYSQGIFDYRVLVLIKFADEQRQYDVFVKNNALSEAFSSSWDEETETWGTFSSTPYEEAQFFTIPGLFTMLRNDLMNQDVKREAIRMTLMEGEAYPGVIFLGNIIREGVEMEGTELVIEVLEMEIQTP